jgi:restriction system protein
VALAAGQGRYDHEKWARQQVREEERRQRAEAAELKVAERQRKAAGVEAARAEAERLNAELDDRVDALRSILSSGLDRPARIDLSEQQGPGAPPELDLGSRATAPPRPRWEDFAPAEPGAFGGLFGGGRRYERLLAEARADFERAGREYDNADVMRQRWVRKQRARHDEVLRAHRSEVERHSRRAQELAAGLARRDRESVQKYLEEVLARTPLPDGLPRQAEVAYSPHGEQAVVRFELPTVEVVPQIAAYTYVATTDTMKEKLRTSTQIAELYRLIVSQVALLCMRDLFEADSQLENVELGGHVHSISPETGQREYPCLISVAVDRATYNGLNLRDVTPPACLRHLNALVSQHPHLVEAVTPVRNFDLARFSFTESVDVVAGMDSRTDLTKMTATEFEHFVRQLFEASGMNGWTTQRSGDDGVDAVVLNPDPMVGGLAIVQVKKYTRVLGVNHIRELVGAMDEKRAGRGILVTTSWFASGCWTKASENGRVELIDGPRLRYLAQEHLKMDVLVAPPTGRVRTWQPPKNL